MLAGGGSLLDGIDERLSRDLGLSVKRAADPLAAVVKRLGQLLADHALLERVVEPDVSALSKDPVMAA